MWNHIKKMANYKMEGTWDFESLSTDYEDCFWNFMGVIIKFLPEPISIWRNKRKSIKVMNIKKRLRNHSRLKETKRRDKMQIKTAMRYHFTHRLSCSSLGDILDPGI